MLRIAVIEDERDAAEMLQILLSEATYDARLFSGGSQFLRSFRRGSFDLIVLDIGLPEMDGYETFDHIRKTDKNVPVIALTGYSFPNDRDQTIGRGFAAHISKPILAGNGRREERGQAPQDCIACP
jgi:CheY-like chemotaxis protein